MASAASHPPLPAEPASIGGVEDTASVESSQLPSGLVAKAATVEAPVAEV